MRNNHSNLKTHPQLIVSDEVMQNAMNIAEEIYSPLKGFLRKDDFYSVLETMRLINRQIWSIPIVLDITKSDYFRLKDEHTIVLMNKELSSFVLLKNIEFYTYKKQEYVQKVFGTTDINHPGVDDVMKKGDYLVGGDITDYQEYKKKSLNFYYSPKETKKIFQQKGWKTIVAFQTRNVPHRSHEYLQKDSLTDVDGLFIQPVIGRKKKGDFKDEVILATYTLLLEKYYPKGRYFLGILPMKMNYAGPREAVMHAVIRKNFGCTHMIVGRDHAGVGNFYGPYDAHNIFNHFNEEELGIKIIKYGDVAYCSMCEDFMTSKTCDHLNDNKLSLSGTKIRGMIKDQKILPEQLIRPEISNFLLNHPNPFVE